MTRAKIAAAGFTELAGRFRRATSEKQFEAACQRGGQLVWDAIDDGLIVHGVIGLERPAFSPADPLFLASAYAHNWAAFIVAFEHLPRFPANAHALEQKTSDGVGNGWYFAGRWESRCETFADVAEWLASLVDDASDADALSAIGPDSREAVVLQTMLELGAVSPERRLGQQQIVEKAYRGESQDSRRVFTKLTGLGLVLKGDNGQGYYLTELGIRAAGKLKRALIAP